MRVHCYLRAFYHKKPSPYPSISCNYHFSYGMCVSPEQCLIINYACCRREENNKTQCSAWTRTKSLFFILIKKNCVEGQLDVCLASALVCIYIYSSRATSSHILMIAPLAQDRKSIGMSSLLLQLHFRRNDKSY